MRGVSDIRELIASLGGQGAYEIIEGTVEAVDVGQLTVDVLLDEGVVLPDVRLRAVSDGGKMGLVAVPTRGSQVVFAQVRGEADYILIKTSELDRVVVEVDDVVLDINDKGMEMKKGNVSLRSLLEDLSALLKQFKVTTPSGPSTAILPDTMAAITDFETKFKTLFYA